MTDQNAQNIIATIFKNNQTETDKTDKTIEVNNVDFLNAIFRDSPNNNCPITVSFKGNPVSIEKSKWYGHPWGNNHTTNLPADANNYFSLARFKPNDSGEYRRKKSHFQGLYAVMLDDIGSKISTERLTLTPSWLLETSPENYQAGYILAEPITNSKEADQLMNAIVNAGLCDPGANGPTARLARLPVAVNDKHNPSFQCKLKTWELENRYSISELVNGLQLELIENNQSKQKHNQEKNNRDVSVITLFDGLFFVLFDGYSMGCKQHSQGASLNSWPS